MADERFRKLCWATVGFVLFVILWGALVRATGSGAGCGSHWPTCDGEIVPRSADTAKIIELTHRVTSGLSALMVLAQLVWSRQIFPRGHRVRKAVGWSSLLMVVEVLIGAGIVLLKYVADDQSLGRAAWMAVHLVNTFLLMGAVTLSAHFASGGRGFRIRAAGSSGVLALSAVAGTILVGMSGAVAALGDTLFPAENLASAIAADLSPAAHVFVRLRVLHPFIAVAVAFLILAMRFVLAARREDDAEVQRWGTVLRSLVVIQMAAGLANLVLMAPVWMQLVHLLLADLLWMALTIFIANALAVTPARAEDAAAASRAAA